MMLKQIVDTTTTTAYLGAYEPIGTLPRRHMPHSEEEEARNPLRARCYLRACAHQSHTVSHRNDTTRKFWIKSVEVRVEFAVRGASKWENR